MKKLTLLLLCIILSILFVSCSKNANSNVKATNLSNNQEISEIAKETDNKTEKNGSSKNIIKLYIDYNGFKTDVNTDEEGVSELLQIEDNATAPDAKLTTALADVFAVYDDNSENLYGTIYAGDDGAYYLKFANSKNKDAAYKMTDSIF